jgi:hypothetical protein
MREELKGIWEANTNSLVWRQVIHKNGRPVEETCHGSFGFLPKEDNKGMYMVFIVYKENEEEHSIAIPKDVLQTALTQGWFPKRGSER